MDRILDIPAERRTPEQNEVFERLSAGRGRILTPYRVWIHSPEVASGMETIGTYLNKRSTLSRREVEIGIILIARHWQGEYVLQAHVREGRNAGIDQETLDLLEKGERPVLADDHEQATHDFIASTLSGAVPTDEEFARYEHILTRKGVAEALVLIGYYSSVALAMKSHRVQPRS